MEKVCRKQMHVCLLSAMRLLKFVKLLICLLCIPWDFVERLLAFYCCCGSGGASYSMEGEELGTMLTISGSKVEGQEAVSCPKGSSFSVKNLFFNVPARRKFLKSNQTELSNILTEFERIVLVNPEVSFTLHHNGAELFNLPALQLRQRIMGVFGKKINQELLSLDVDTTMVRVSGFVGKPETARKKGARQYFFVNGRYMRHPYFHKAIMDAYEQLVPVGEQVSYFIYFEVDPANIDVNIHPTKTEIKFENEQAIWQILAAAVKETLGKFNAVPSIDFDTEGMPDIPAFDASPYTGIQPPKTTYNPDYNPFNVSAAPPLLIQSLVRTGNNCMRGWNVMLLLKTFILTRMIIGRKRLLLRRKIPDCMIMWRTLQSVRNPASIISLKDVLF